MDRLFGRDQPLMKLRVRLGPIGRSSSLPTLASVEWVGRAGHPSSYGLLMGEKANSPRIDLLGEQAAQYREALASHADKVFWGLPVEYATVVAGVLSLQPQAVRITDAAHGEIGSSAHVFAALARLLCRLLAGDLPAEDTEVWRIWDRCWTDR